MNANELIENARKIVGKPLGELRAFQLLPQIQLSADMLCQLQAEIEALKAENKFFKDLMGDVEILRKAQENV